MEGTRHERVAMVLAAYIIGFATAFIAFGVTQLEDEVQFVYVPTPAQTASVVNAVAEPAQSVHEVGVRMTETGLMYVANGQEVLLSAYGEATNEDGVHNSIYEFALSPDKQFVYFCEVPAADTEACKPFVYSVSAAAVYPVTEGGSRIALPLTETELTWGEAGLEAISGLAVDPNPF